MDNKIVTARFATDDNYVNVYDVYQWDYGQVLRIEGLKLPNMVEIHFSLQETSGEAKTRIGVTKDGVTDVVIPDSFLENEGIGDNYKIFVWVYVADKESGSTEYKITIHVKVRAKPEITHGGQDGEVFQEAVEAVRGAAKRAAESEKQAERWAVGRVDVPGAETDNSKFYAEESKKNAQQTTKDKEAVEELVKKTENIGQFAEEVKANAQKASESAKNAETSATNASASEKNAKTSESNASTSETNAKASETNAKASEQAVEESKQAVDKAVADFGQAVTDASATLKAEKDAHVKAITTTGTTETKKVTDEGAKQVEMVQSIGTQETEKVTAEGTKQVGLVKTEGEKHLAAVQTAAQEIIADREQIAKNKTDIADLRQGKADAIIESVSGTLLNVKDSAYAKIVNLKINNNVDWLKVTGKNLLNVQGEKTGNNINLMEFGTGRIKYTTQDDYGGGYVAYAQVFKAGTYMFSAKITKDGESEKGIRLGFNKEVKIKNDTLIYNSYYKHYFMQDYAETIEITSGEEFTLMIALNSATAVKGSVIEISEIQMEQGNTVTNYESYCEEQNVIAPITEDKLNTLHTNYPTTIISNSENAEMQLTYIADTKNYYLGREEILQKQILEIQNALISQKISGGGIKVTNSAKLPIVKLSVFGKSEQTTTTGKNLWSLGDVSFNGYKELSVNYPAGNYVLSFDVNTPASSMTVQVGINIDGNWKYNQVKKDNRAAIKISSATGITAVRFYAGDSPAVKDNAEYYNIQIEKRADATDYEPYTGGKPSPSPEYPQGIAAKEFKDIKIHGKNLLGGKYYYVSYSLGVGFIKEDTFNQEPIFPYTPAEEVKGVGKTMYCKKGTTYTLSVTNANSNYAISIAEYASVEDTKNKDKCIGNARVSSTDRISYTALNDGILLCYIAGKWTDGTTTIHTCTDTELLQVEIGETATAYEPYTEQTFSLSEPVTLNALKVDVNGNYTDETGQQWITDEIDLARGKYVQRIAKYVFDGSEELADNIGSKTSYFLKVNDIRSNTGMCNYGKRIPVTGQKQEELTFCVDDNGIYLYTTKAVNEFKNLLKQKYDSGKPVEVLYALKTPIETDLPPETIAAFKKLHTNYHTTIVSNNADAGMELTYTVDTQSYIDSKIAEVSKALL